MLISWFLLTWATFRSFSCVTKRCLIWIKTVQQFRNKIRSIKDANQRANFPLYYTLLYPWLYFYLELFNQEIWKNYVTPPINYINRSASNTIKDRIEKLVINYLDLYPIKWVCLTVNEKVCLHFIIFSVAPN